MKSQNEFQNLKKRNTTAMTIITILLVLSSGTIFVYQIPPVHAQNATTSTEAASGTTNASLTAEIFGPPDVGSIIPNQWLVTLRPNATDDSQQARSAVAALSADAESGGVQVNQSFPELGILVIQTPPNTFGALAALDEDPNVLAIEPNRVVGISEQTIPTGVDRIDAEPNSTSSKVNQTGGAANATIAIIDTGIDLEHPDLNVIRDVSFVGTPTGDDDQGHGTHVAGTVAAKDDSAGVAGVSPGSNLIAVKVLDSGGSGSTASVVAGIDYVRALANETDVANLSLGGGFSTALNTAVTKAVESGIPMVVAAGNDDADASLTSPASTPEAITVSSIVDTDGKCGGLGPGVVIRGELNPDDSFAGFSNHGEIIDITSPGTRINSTEPLSLNPTGYGIKSGTSMAAPHVAGAVALYKSAHPGALPDQIRDAIIALATSSATDCMGTNPGYLEDRSRDNDDIAEPLLYTTGLR